MTRLLPKQIKQTREQLVEAQGCTCAVCGAPIKETDRVHLDHNHKTGAVRGALHGQCNMLLGKLENGLRRGIPDPEGFLKGVAEYLELHKSNQTGLLHPTHLTPEEKKAKAKRRAQKRKEQK